MGDRLLFGLGYGALFVATMLWAGHRFRRLRGRNRMATLARGCSLLAALLLAMGLVLYGLRVGYWPFHTDYELLSVGLLGLVSAQWALLSPHQDGLIWLVLSTLSSLAAIYGLSVGSRVEPATFVHNSGWWVAYVVLSAFGGGGLVVAGTAAIVAPSRKCEGQFGEKAVTQRALAWGLLALSAGLASGTWWFQRLSGRYWGDARWIGLVVAWLLVMAAWHGRREWLGRGWRSALVGVVLGLVGVFVALGRGTAG